MATRIIDPIARTDWNRILNPIAESSFFLSSNWAGVLKDCYLYKPLYFANFDGQVLSTLFPVMEVDSFLTGKRGVSLPFTDYCEPVARDQNQFSAMLDEVSRYGRKAGWRYLELRGGTEYLKHAVAYSTFLRHILKIHDHEPTLLSQTKPSTRRNIRKATESGVRITISDSKGDLDTYYELHCLTRKRHGFPPQPRRFFRAVHRNVIAKGMGFTVLGSYQGRAIAGAVYFHSGRKGIYKYGAADLAYQHVRASNLVMWEAIRWFSRNGFEELCLGRTDLQNSGLIRFKQGWGSRESQISYYRFDPRSGNAMNNTGFRIPYALLRKIPSPVSRILGALLYKHMG